MSTAQKLYEAGLITYMRTDSVTLSNDAKSSIVEKIETKYGNKYVNLRDYKIKTNLLKKHMKQLGQQILMLRKSHLIMINKDCMS